MNLNGNNWPFLGCSILALCLLFIMSGCAGDNKIKFTFEPKFSDDPRFAVSRIDNAVVEIKEKDGPVVKIIDLTDSFKKNQSESIEFTTKDITNYRDDKVYHLSAILNAEIQALTIVKKNDRSPIKKVFEGSSELAKNLKFKQNTNFNFVVEFHIAHDKSGNNIIPILDIVSSSQIE